MNKTTIEISPRTIVFTVFFILSLYVVWILLDLLFSLLIAFIVMSALKPFVHALEMSRLPRMLSALLVYILFLIIIFSLVSLIIPPIIVETTLLIRNLPFIIQNLNPAIGSWIQLDSLFQYVPDVTNQALKILTGLFSNVFFVVSTLFFGFYFLVEENIIKRFLMRFFDEKKAHHISLAFVKAEKRMSAWFWGQLMLMILVGVLSFIGLQLIGIKYALPLAVLAGLLEVVPNIGPTIAAVPAVLIGFSQSHFLGVSALALSLIVQQLENSLIVPAVMKTVVGINPITTLIALIIGGKIGGVLGILLAIPTFLLIETIYMEFRNTKEFSLPIPPNK